MAYFLIGMGAQTLFVGKQRFQLTLIYACATLSFFTVLIGLSAAGQLNFLEESHHANVKVVVITAFS